VDILGCRGRWRQYGPSLLDQRGNPSDYQEIGEIGYPAVGEKIEFVRDMCRIGLASGTLLMNPALISGRADEKNLRDERQDAGYGDCADELRAQAQFHDTGGGVDPIVLWIATKSNLSGAVPDGCNGSFGEPALAGSAYHWITELA